MIPRTCSLEERVGSCGSGVRAESLDVRGVSRPVVALAETVELTCD